MVKLEGVGWSSPGFTVITFDDKEIAGIRIVAKYISEHKQFEFDNCLVGLYGESALAKHIERHTGIHHLFNGSLLGVNSDGGIDITVAEINIQVKTHRPGKPCLVRRLSNGKFIKSSLVSDVFFFCEVYKANTVRLLGWIEKDGLTIHSEIINIAGNSFLQIQTKYLEPTSRLITRIQNIQYLERNKLNVAY